MFGVVVFVLDGSSLVLIVGGTAISYNSGRAVMREMEIVSRFFLCSRDQDRVEFEMEDVMYLRPGGRSHGDSS